MPCVVTQTASRLSVRSRPSAWLMGVLWLIFVAYSFWVLPSPRLQMQRTRPGMARVIVEHRLMGMTLSRETIENVGGAEVETQDLTRVVLLTSQGAVPLSTGFSVGAAHHHAAAAEINGFLRNPEPSSTVITVRISTLLWAAGAFLALVAGMATFGSWMECTLDRERDQVVLGSVGLFRRRQQEYRLRDVERFLILRKDNLDYETREQWPHQFTVGFRLRTGKEVPVTRLLETRVSDESDDLCRRLEKFRRGLDSSVTENSGSARGFNQDVSSSGIDSGGS